MMGSIAKARIRPDLAGSLSGARCIPRRYAGPRVATSIDLTPATQHTTVAARARLSELPASLRHHEVPQPQVGGGEGDGDHGDSGALLGERPERDR